MTEPRTIGGSLLRQALDELQTQIDATPAMKIPWRKLLTKVGKWLIRKGSEEALKELQKRKERGQL